MPVDALILLVRRLDEAGDHAAALDAIVQAEKELDDGDLASRGIMRRLRGASLLRLRRIDDAFGALDDELALGKRRILGGTYVLSLSSASPWDAALAEAATVAMWAAASTPEWVRALGGIAEHASETDRRALWERFERALVAMVDGSQYPGSDLEVVIRQATQRGFDATARTANDLAERRGIALVDNFHLG